MMYFLIAALAGMAVGVVTRSLISAFVNTGIFWLLAWFFMPTLASGYYLTVVFFALMTGSVWAWAAASSEVSDSTKRIAGFGALLLILMTLIFSPLFTTWGAFHASDYRSLLEVTEKDFDTGQVLLDQSQARFVDQELAVRSAHELLGNMQGLGSMVDIGTMSVQSINGRLWWVGQLEHNGFFKWWTNGTTPGYVMVSANNYSDRKIVDDKHFRIGMEAYFGDNLVRHLYENGYATTGYTDYTFELDDEGSAHWVVTLIAPKVGFGGFVATGIAVVDPETGKIDQYTIEDAPAWVDRIEPEDLIENRVDDWGMYVKGWLNSWTSGVDVIKPSDSMALVYTADGRSAWYTGLQSNGSSLGGEQGTMGFMLVDTRTGKASFYRRAGITEDAAKKALEGAVQEKNYTATSPVPYLVGGVPTFISVLKDVSGNMQMVGLVAYNDRTILATGNTLGDAMRTYTSKLRDKGTALALGGAAKTQTFAGTVVLWATEQIKDDTYVTFMIDTVPNKAFSMSGHLTQEVILTKVGARVKIEVTETGTSIIVVDKFDNEDIALEETQDEKAMTERYEQAIKARNERKDQVDAGTVLKNLDPATLNALLEAVRKSKAK